jgi:A/G-specific adenine glycosylase
MSSPHTKISPVAYLKAASDCKEEIASWPVGLDTARETDVKQKASGGLTDSVVSVFQKLVYVFFAEQRRDLPWREGNDPYPILVSEVMLQQTQVERVLPKFSAFMERFPTLTTLAAAPLPELLASWQGLGYNRRAMNLQRAARIIVEEWAGTIPDDPLQLQQLPGIGPYTSGAIVAFAFNRPNIFLETNIRAVLLHFFFPDQEKVTDKELLPIATAILDRHHPRDWYNALMDYGSDLKRRFPNPSRRSRHHTVQSRFEGSDRQVRGAVLRMLLDSDGISLATLQKQLKVETEKLTQILDKMIRDGFLKKQGRRFSIRSA